MTESARGSPSTEHATSTLVGQGQAAGGLREVDPFAARRWTRLPDVPEHPVATEVAASVAAAVRLARARLATRLPGRVLEEAGSYFEAPTVDRWDGGERPAVSASDLFGDLCAVPRSVSVRDKAAGLQLEVRTLDEAFDPEALGTPVEPGSEVLMLSPRRLEAAAASNCSIELRQFDRQCPAWTAFADDLVTVTGADVFLKLFVADGNISVNGWHRDASDVLVTAICGAKRFAVADVPKGQPEDNPTPTVDALLHPGDVLRLPRAMLHCATPNDGLSALLSMGLMRPGDWPYRQVPPTHLGFHDYPRSASLYRLCLRAHTPPTRPSEVNLSRDTLRSRLPGGLALLHIQDDEASFLAAGAVYEADVALVRVLAAIHGADGINAPGVSDATGIPESGCREKMHQLLTHGLVRSESG